MRSSIRCMGGVAVVLAVLLTGLATAVEPTGTATNGGSDVFPLLKTDAITFKPSADIRIRQEHFNDIPIVRDPPGVTRGGENSYYRFRTRIGEDIGFGPDATLRIRLCNEWRDYVRPASSTASEWPDETVVDQLYLDLRNLFGMPVDVKIGRQEMIYGSGKVILEGTPKDGSRTIYFDAAKITLRPNKETSIDLLGIYNEPENHLALSSEHRDLTGYDSAYNNVTESGAGVYAKNCSVKEFPFEAYYLYKNESDWTNSANVTQPEREVHTVGARIMPVIVKDRLNMNLEGAYQIGTLGDNDCSGYMADAALKWSVPCPLDTKPSLSAGVYILSGDDPETADDEGWNPLWARYPQYSELYVYAFDAEAAGRWSNVTMPYLELAVAPHKNLTVTALAGQMLAAEDNGPGDGKERGMLYTLWGRFVLAENKLLPKDKLYGHLVLEMLDPGDYYNVTEDAYFFRWEVSYMF